MSECTCKPWEFCPKQGRKVSPHLIDLCHRPEYRQIFDRIEAARPEPIKPPDETRKAAAPKQTPGAELQALIASLGLSSEGCGACAGMARMMDRWEVEGCERHRDEILKHLRQKQAGLGWIETLRATGNAVSLGIILNPLDPAPGLLQLALDRCRANAPKEDRSHEPHEPSTDARAAGHPAGPLDQAGLPADGQPG